MRRRDHLLLYSTNTWLAFQISERYFGREHYVWCTPYFDASRSLEYKVPPSSCPAEIYKGFRKEVAGRERHSDRIKANKAGLLQGAQQKFKNGKISRRDMGEITAVVEKAEVMDFAPLIFVIPYSLVEDRLSDVPIGQRAHPLSVEYIIEALPRGFFDVLHFEGT
jgi:hypothetical protein